MRKVGQVIDFEIDNEKDGKSKELVITNAISSALLCGETLNIQINTCSPNLITEAQQITSTLATKTEIVREYDQSSELPKGNEILGANTRGNTYEYKSWRISKNHVTMLILTMYSRPNSQITYLQPKKREVSSSDDNPVRPCKCAEKERACCLLCKKNEFHNIERDDVNQSFYLEKIFCECEEKILV